MKRTALTASLFGSAAAALLAVAAATPASAQSTTYPKGTDCTVIQDSASRTDCLNQQSQSQQMQNNNGTMDGGTPRSGSEGVAPSQAPGSPGASEPGIPGGGPTSGPSSGKQ